MGISIASDLKEKQFVDFIFDKYECAAGHQENLKTTMGETLAFVYVTSGEISLSIENETKRVNTGEYLFFFLSGDDMIKLNSHSDSNHIWLQFHPMLFINRLTSSCCFIDRILESVTSQKTSFLLDQAVPNSPGIVHVLGDIQRAFNKSSFQYYFLNAYGYQLMGLFLEQQELLTSDCDHISDSHVEKMHQVRALIEENVQKSLSISELAKEVGTNVAYLKKHFKETFGTTVYGYTLTHKMELSKSLLSDTNHNISDVAFQVGYKHATHFSQAFKKYYGYLPNSIKRAICFIWGLDSVSYISLLAF